MNENFESLNKRAKANTVLLIVILSLVAFIFLVVLFAVIIIFYIYSAYYPTIQMLSGIDFVKICSQLSSMDLEGLYEEISKIDIEELTAEIKNLDINIQRIADSIQSVSDSFNAFKGIFVK